VAVLIAAIAACFFVLPGCGTRDQRAPGPLRVVVTVPPLIGLVKPLLPVSASVKALMAPGRSEHGYEFTPGDVAALGDADIVVYVGVGLEPEVAKFLEQHPSKRRRVASFAAAGLEAADQPHSHDSDHAVPHDDHEHADPHLWLDAEACEVLVSYLAVIAKESLNEMGDRQSAAAVDAAATKLKAEIHAVDEEYRSRLAPLKGRSFITHHDAWGRIADRYGLQIAAVIRGPDAAEAGPGAIARTIEAVRSHNAKALFIEPQFDAIEARRIAEATGVRVGVLDPLGNGDWFAMMRSNLDSLVKNLGD